MATTKPAPKAGAPAPASPPDVETSLREAALKELAELDPFYRMKQIHYHIAGRNEQYGTTVHQYTNAATLSLEPSPVCRTDRCRRGFLLTPEDIARLALLLGIAPDHPEVRAILEASSTEGFYLSDDAAQEVFAAFFVGAKTPIPR